MRESLYSSSAVFLSAGALLVACGGASMATYTPVHHETKYSEDSLFIAARTASDRLGYAPHASDSGSHSLITREKQVAVSSVPRLSYKYAFKIDTSGGVLSIEADCSQNSATSEDTFSDCGDDRPERVVKEMAALEKEILSTAPSSDRDKTDWGALDDSKKGAADDTDKDDERADKASGKKSDKADKKADHAEKKADKSEDKADKKADKAEDKSDKKAEKSDDKDSKGKKSDKSDKDSKGKKTAKADSDDK